MRLMAPVFGGAAKAAMGAEGENAGAQMAAGLNMMNNMTVLRIVSLITGMMRIEVSKETLLEMNAKLNEIVI